MEVESIEFTKKVDSQGRLIVPKEHSQALSIEGREALVKFKAEKIVYLDENNGGDV